MYFPDVRRASLRMLVTWATVALLSLDISAVHADDSSPEPVLLSPVVITATRLPTSAEEVASSVTVITSQEIDSKQERTLPDVLKDVPGLNVVQTGGPGGQTSLFMRGTNSNHTKVLIDGIDVSDPTTPNGAFDFAHLLTSDIDRVEVLRGPQSGLYGSDAIGGVVNIITKKGTGPAQFTGSLEGGSFDTFNQTGGVSGSTDRYNYALDVAHFRSGATPVTPLNLLPPGEKRNDDTYDNKTISTKLGAKLADNFDIGFVVRYVDTTLQFTGENFNVFPAVPDSTRSESDTQQLFTRGTAHLMLFNGVFDQTVGVGYTDYDRHDLSPDTVTTRNRGDRVKVDWQGNIKLAESEILTVGAEHQLDEIVESPVSARMTNNAGFFQLQSGLGERLFDTVSLRYDNNDHFGGEATYRIAPAFLIPQIGTKIKGSVGTGFKAPSLNELFVSFPSFGFFANPKLKPETSFGYDVGFEQSVMEHRILFGATYFHNDISDLITTNAAGTSFDNVSKATTYGVESFVLYQPLDTVEFRADYTYTIATDEILHEELLRRPKNKAALGVSWQAAHDLSFSGTILYVGPWIDGNRDFSIPRLKAGGYTTFNLAATYDVTSKVSVFARVNNLFDRRYQDPVGFQQPGLGIFGGLQTRF